MNTKTIDLHTPDGTCDALIAHPETGTHPAVILYMDAFGLRPYLEEMACRLAKEGFFVLVPNLFYRIKRAPVVNLKFPLKAEDMAAAIPSIIPLARGHDPNLTLKDAETFLEFLSNHPLVQKGKIGVTGYCMGGSLSIRTAAQFPDRIAAAASYHAGNLASEAPNSPHLLLGSIQARLYVAHADQDSSMPSEQISRFETALKASQVNGSAELYPGALHGFTMKDLPAYNESALNKHWETLVALFKASLNSFSA